MPADGRQLGFWGGDQAAHDRADRALARVQGMLGYDAVATAVVQGGRTPAEQVRWVPWGDAREPQRPLVVDTFPTAWPGELPSPFPARVFDPPVPHNCPTSTAVRSRYRDAVSNRPPPRGSSARSWRLGVAYGPGPVLGGPTCGGVGPATHRRCARWQVVVDCGGATVATLRVWSLWEAGRAGVEAIYD